DQVRTDGGGAAGEVGEAGELLLRDVRVVDHLQHGRRAAGGQRLQLGDRLAPLVQLELLQEPDGAPVHRGVQQEVQAADVHERREQQADARAQLRRIVFLARAVGARGAFEVQLQLL